MTKYITIIFTTFFFACNNKQSQTFNIPPKQELNKIIEAVIYQDSLPVFKTNSYLYTGIVSDSKKTITPLATYPLSINLRKLTVIIPDTTKTVPPPINNDAVSIFRLLHGLIKLKPNGQTVIPVADYNYILFQNTVLKNFSIKNDFANNIIVTSFNEQQQKYKQGIPRQYYDLTIPILSADGKKAYVEVTFNCSGLCGGAIAIYLEKKDKRWQIINRERLWRS